MPSKLSLSADVLDLKPVQNVRSADDLLEVLRVHSALQAKHFERILDNDVPLDLNIAEALEDLGSDYMKLSDEVRTIVLAKVKRKAKALVPTRGRCK